MVHGKNVSIKAMLPLHVDNFASMTMMMEQGGQQINGAAVVSIAAT
jgi:hypothetical protein